MREQLNENPAAQVGLVALLVVVAAFMFIRGGGGGEEEESAGAEATVSVEGTGQTATASGASAGEAVESAAASALESSPEAAAGSTAIPAPPLPKPVTKAYRSGSTVVLLFVHDGGIDDKLVKQATAGLAGASSVSLFVVPAKQIARYAAATVGLEVNRVPALVVMRPKHLSGGTPQASVDYGFLTSSDVQQAVKDAGYKGRELQYHPN